MADPRFHRSVIYVCAHSSEGAMGLIINQRAQHITLPKLLEQLEIKPNGSRPAAMRSTAMAVHTGGPVETSRGFVLHSSDYFAADSTLTINESVCLTATVDILKAIAKGSGPDKAILALGYSGWASGQLSAKSNRTAGFAAPPIMTSFSTATLKASTPERSIRWAWTRCILWNRRPRIGLACNRERRAAGGPRKRPSPQIAARQQHASPASSS